MGKWKDGGRWNRRSEVPNNKSKGEVCQREDSIEMEREGEVQRGKRQRLIGGIVAVRMKGKWNQGGDSCTLFQPNLPQIPRV